MRPNSNPFTGYRRFLVTLSLVCTLFATIIQPLFAQSESGQVKVASVNSSLPTEIRQTLSSGLRVIVVERPAPDAFTPPLTAIDLRVRTGSSVETPANSGISHFIEHLVFKGSDTATLAKPGEIDTSIEERAGELNASTSKDWTRFAAVVPLANWQNALTSLSTLVLHPAFRQEDIDRERRVILSEMGVAQAESLRSALAAVNALAYPIDDPNRLSVYGSSANVQNFSSADLRAFHQTHYTPRNMTLVVVGSVKAAEVIKLASALFPAPEKLPETKSGDAIAPPADLHEIVHGVSQIRRDRKITTIGFGFLAPSVQDADAVVLCDVLIAALIGDGNSGRLYDVLVQKANAPALALTTDFLTRRNGNAALIAIIVTAKPEKEKQVETLLFREIERIREDGLSEAEVENAKNIVIGHIRSTEATVEGQARHLAFYDAINAGTFTSKYMERIQAIRAPDLQAAVIKYLPTTRYVETAITPTPVETEAQP